MDFSMNMNRFFRLFALICTVAGCTPGVVDSTWRNAPDDATVSAPTRIGADAPGAMYGTDTSDTTHRMAVLLPLSGQNADTGRAIRTSVEMAVLQNAPKNLTVSFHDTADDADAAIRDAVGTGAEIIIGPLFAQNARRLRTARVDTIPALSFTSDATAVGDGVMTMSLMPANSIDVIIGEMASDGVHNFIILAPDTASGRLMAGTALRGADIYGTKNVGVIYYAPGDADAIKDAASNAAMYAPRAAANTRAREILADILTTQQLTAIEKSSLNMQLEKISKSDTTGPVPYDAVLFLGDGADTKKLASFLRYYGVGARDARFYGTAVWDGADIASDVTMSGAKYAALPATNENFANVYEMIYDAAPSRLASFGYDAANMAIGMIYSNKSHAAYLLDPSGYIGVDGLVRLRPNGTNERALRILQLNGTGTPREIRAAPANFITPIYNIDQRTISPAPATPLETRGINPTDYIQIPQRFSTQYRSKTFGANMPAKPNAVAPRVVDIIPAPADDTTITSPDFQPTHLETVNRTYIDSVEISE